MTDPDHPIWRLAQTTLYLAFAAFFLWHNASDFDDTEIKTLVELGTIMFVGEGIKRKFKGSGNDGK